jgi:hypothetical protein
VEPNSGLNLGSVLVIPGFLSGLESWAGFAASLAENGYEAVVAGQRVLKRGHRDPTGQHAKDISLVLRHIYPLGLPDLRGIVAHSYGFIKAERFLLEEEVREPLWLHIVVLIGLAPAGLSGRSGLHDQAKRYREMIAIERRPMHQELSDNDGELIKISVGTLLRQPIRSVLEGIQVLRHTVVPEQLLTSVRRVEIIGFQGDRFITANRLHVRLDAFDGSPNAEPRLNLTVPEDSRLMSHNNAVFNLVETASIVTQLIERRHGFE